MARLKTRPDSLKHLFYLFLSRENQSRSPPPPPPFGVAPERNGAISSRGRERASNEVRRTLKIQAHKILGIHLETAWKQPEKEKT